MRFYLGVLILSFGVTMAVMVPFIGLLYRWKFTRGRETEEKRKTATKAFYEIRKMHAVKAGVPTGGGIPVAAIVAGFFFVVFLFVERGVTCRGPPGRGVGGINFLFFLF